MTYTNQRNSNQLSGRYSPSRSSSGQNSSNKSSRVNSLSPERKYKQGVVTPSPSSSSDDGDSDGSPREYKNPVIMTHLATNPEFNSMIRSILKERARLPDQFINAIMTPLNMKELEVAFTHPSYDQTSNYEFYEFIGDSTVNKCIVWYCKRRFPRLHNEKGVQKFSQLKANLVSKRSLSSLADKMNFWKFIRMSVETQQRDKRKVLEDVFEAFIGCLENIVDQSLNMHSGYGVCYTIISTILEKITISLKETDLKDPKTRLKEIFDKSKVLNELVYKVKEARSETNNMFGVQAVGIVNGKFVEMGYGQSNIKRQAEKNAAKAAIKWLTKYKLM